MSGYLIEPRTSKGRQVWRVVEERDDGSLHVVASNFPTRTAALRATALLLNSADKAGTLLATTNEES